MVSKRVDGNKNISYTEECKNLQLRQGATILLVHPSSQDIWFNSKLYD